MLRRKLPHSIVARKTLTVLTYYTQEKKPNKAENNQSPEKKVGERTRVVWRLGFVSMYLGLVAGLNGLIRRYRVRHNR